MARQCSRRRARKRSGNGDEAAELRCTGGANGVANAQAAAKTGPDLAPPLQKHSITVAAVPHRLPARDMESVESRRRESFEVIALPPPSAIRRKLKNYSESRNQNSAAGVIRVVS